jgi:hypothetical protein
MHLARETQARSRPIRPLDRSVAAERRQLVSPGRKARGCEPRGAQSHGAAADQVIRTGSVRRELGRTRFLSRCQPGRRANWLFIDRGMTALRSEDDVDEEIRQGVCHAGNHRSVAAPRLFCLMGMEPRASRHRATALAPLRGCFVSEIRARVSPTDTQPGRSGTYAPIDVGPSSRITTYSIFPPSAYAAPARSPGRTHRLVNFWQWTPSPSLRLE